MTTESNSVHEADSDWLGDKISVSQIMYIMTTKWQLKGSYSNEAAKAIKQYFLKIVLPEMRTLQSEIERLIKENEEVRCKNIGFETCNDELKNTIAELVEENKWYIIADGEFDENEIMLWCRVPYVGSMCDLDFPGLDKFTHYRKLPNSFFPKIDNQL